jgi:hypothetical protein
VVTEEWVQESVRRCAWAEVAPYLHPMYSRRRQAGGDRADRVLQGVKVCVLESVNPPTEVLVDLVRAAGGAVTAAVGEEDIAFVVFGALLCGSAGLYAVTVTAHALCTGDVCAGNDWVEGKLKKHKSETHREVADARAWAREDKVVTCQVRHSV